MEFTNNWSFTLDNIFLDLFFSLKNKENGPVLYSLADCISPIVFNLIILLQQQIVNANFFAFRASQFKVK